MIFTLMDSALALPHGMTPLDRLKALRSRLTVGSALLIAGALGFIALTVAVVASAEEDLPTCHVESAVLAYPRYTNKGLIDGYNYRCGKPNGGCTLRKHTTQGPVYDCSPFAFGGKRGVM